MTDDKVICTKARECVGNCLHNKPHIRGESCDLTSCSEFSYRGVCIPCKENRGAVYDR